MVYPYLKPSVDLPLPSLDHCFRVTRVRIRDYPKQRFGRCQTSYRCKHACKQPIIAWGTPDIVDSFEVFTWFIYGKCTIGGISILGYHASPARLFDMMSFPTFGIQAPNGSHPCKRPRVYSQVLLCKFGKCK